MIHGQESISPVCNLIFVIGFMGTGKTAAGREAARLAGCFWSDLDQEIEEQINMSISEYMSAYGEEAFRDQESEVLAGLIELLKKQNHHHIISCGGGVILRWMNRKLMRESGMVIRLMADPSVICQRVLQDNPVRPLLSVDGGGVKAVRERIEALMKKREPLYEETADITIRTDALSTGEVARAIVRAAGI